MKDINKEEMFVYSGKCRKGKCGTPTPFVDVHENPLHVGDIVLSFVQGKEDEFMDIGNLTVVVSDKYETYTDGTHKIKDGNEEFFVMGIKDAFPIDKCDDDYEYKNYQWNVLKVKDNQDVIDGEYWVDFGFNFKLEAEND